MKKKVNFLLFPAAMILLLFSCRGDPEKDPDRTSTLLELTSSYTEIVVFSAKVPGYWAKKPDDGTRLFLYLFSLDHSFKKGDLLTVEGASGNANAAIFNEEYRTYLNEFPTIIFAAWKAEKYKNGSRSVVSPPRRRG